MISMKVKPDWFRGVIVGGAFTIHHIPGRDGPVRKFDNASMGAGSEKWRGFPRDGGIHSSLRVSAELARSRMGFVNHAQAVFRISLPLLLAFIVHRAPEASAYICDFGLCVGAPAGVAIGGGACPFPGPPSRQCGQCICDGSDGWYCDYDFPPNPCPYPSGSPTPSHTFTAADCLAGPAGPPPRNWPAVGTDPSTGPYRCQCTQPGGGIRSDFYWNNQTDYDGKPCGDLPTACHMWMCASVAVCQPGSVPVYPPPPSPTPPPACPNPSVLGGPTGCGTLGQYEDCRPGTQNYCRCTCKDLTSGVDISW